MNCRGTLIIFTSWLHIIVNSTRTKKVGKNVMKRESSFNIKRKHKEGLVCYSFMLRSFHSELIFKNSSKNISNWTLLIYLLGCFYNFTTHIILSYLVPLLLLLLIFIIILFVSLFKIYQLVVKDI